MQRPRNDQDISGRFILRRAATAARRSEKNVMASLPGFSAAGAALGFGANALANQFAPEDEERRKKRLAAMNAAQGNIGLKLAAGYGAALGSYSPAGSLLFGGR